MPFKAVFGIIHRRAAEAAIALLWSLLPPAPSGAAPLYGHEGWDSGFNGARALEHVRVLASDSCRGRYSGFKGADVAERYIAEHFEGLGLAKPFGEDGYAHRFTYGAGEYTMPSGLTVVFSDGAKDTARFWRDLNVFKYSGFGRVKGRVALVGYGVSAPELGWDDYAGVDVKGALALAWRGTPSLTGEDFGNWGASGRKSTFALDQGAVGFLYCESDPPKLATITEEYYRPELPAAWISKSFADSLLKGTGMTKDRWKKLADSTQAPISRELEVFAELQVSGDYYPERPTLNLAGLLLGRDPKLRNEIVVIGAHMDHHGVDPGGNLYPGADDNASGTATMMELARVFEALPERPKRSLLFIGFAAEEEGLVGSMAFVKDMRLPPGMQVTAMLNMDMVGQGNCSLGVGGIDQFPLLGEALFADWPDSVLKALDFWGLYPGSDHGPFQQEGIPSYVIGARGEHPNYHTPGDSAGNINPEVMKAVGDLMFHCAKALADHPEPTAPLVNKAEWLVRANGGIVKRGLPLEEVMWVGEETDEWADECRKGRNALVMQPDGRVKGVSYPTPLVLFAINEPTPSSSRERVAVSSFLLGMEMVRGWADAHRLPFLADSSKQGFKGEPYRGVTVKIDRSDLPADSLLVKVFARNGVGFVSGFYAPFDDWLKLEDWRDEATGADIPGWRAIARDCRRAGIGVWLEAVNTHKDRPIERFPAEFSALWSNRVVCDFSGGHLPEQAGLGMLLDGGWFLVVRDLAVLQRYRGRPEWRRLAIPDDPALVQQLLEVGFKNEELSDLIIDNLARWLAGSR